MFRVDNTDFIANKLAAELLPDQEQREAFRTLTKPSREDARGGHQQRGAGLSSTWTGISTSSATTTRGSFRTRTTATACTASSFERYMTTLAVVGANQNQSIVGNQGMGLKISGPTRHKRGVLIRSLKNGERSMVQVGWDGKQYGLIQLGEHGETVVSAPESAFPAFIVAQGSGTVVTFLGTERATTRSSRPARSTTGFSSTCTVGSSSCRRRHRGSWCACPRVMSEWPHSSEASERQRGHGKSFNFSGVEGTAAVWDEGVEEARKRLLRVVDLPGIPSNDSIPPVKVHWWVLPSGKGSDVSSRTHSGGSLAVAYQNELQDWRTSNQANPFLARMGVLFGKNRFAFVVEPTGPLVASDFARAHVLIDGRPALETEAWLMWADQFRDDHMPEKIRETMQQEQEQLQEEDPDRARRIKDRLKDVMQLLRPKRARRSDNGNVTAGGPELTGPGDGTGTVYGRRSGRASTGRRRPHRAASGLCSPSLRMRKATRRRRSSPCSRSPRSGCRRRRLRACRSSTAGAIGGLRDRAAALGGEDGATAEVLLLNHEFRGYQSIIAAVNEWGNPDGDDEISAKVQTFTREWIEQKMVEAVVGLRQLENGSTWTAGHYDDALSPVALTAAFMADRWHTLREVKRQVGPLRRQPVAVAEETSDNGLKRDKGPRRRAAPNRREVRSHDD